MWSSIATVLGPRTLIGAILDFGSWQLSKGTNHTERPDQTTNFESANGLAEGDVVLEPSEHVPERNVEKNKRCELSLYTLNFSRKSPNINSMCRAEGQINLLTIFQKA